MQISLLLGGEARLHHVVMLTIAVSGVWCDAENHRHNCASRNEAKDTPQAAGFAMRREPGKC